MSEPNINDILSGGGLSSLLQNPDVAAKLPKIMEALGPVMAEMKQEKAEAAPKSDEENSNESTPVFKSKGKSGSSARRCALLHALEPYLSDNRREAMEYIIKVTSLIDMLSEVM
ncbi:MAG: hypothetical protein IJC81_01770 [Clostridia bacterium]|nr:hypothetical protein [Clostridia bacterium]